MDGQLIGGVLISQAELWDIESEGFKLLIKKSVRKFHLIAAKNLFNDGVASL